MKSKKILALGLVGVMAVTTASVTGASAAENAMSGTGATDFSYTPGSSTGGDGDGNVASWTVDYPVKINLDDATVDFASGREVSFHAVNTVGGGDYTGDAVIEASLKKHANATSDGNSVTMTDTSSSTADNVTMQLKSDASTIVKTNVATGNGHKFADLKNGSHEKVLTAYLSSKGTAKTTQTYKTTLTWAFNSAQVTN